MEENERGVTINTPKPTVQNEDIKVKEIMSRVLLEFLVFGTEENKKKILAMNDSLQAQMHKARKGKHTRILWYVDKGEKTPEEKRQWLIEKVYAKYYIFTPEDYKVSKDYVKEVLLKIKKLEDGIRSAKSAGIVVSKNKPVQTEDATIVEDSKAEPLLKIVE